MKIGREEIDINENDLILDNGSIYQFENRYSGIGWNKYPMRLPKTLFKELLKINGIYTNEELKEKAQKRYSANFVTYWKFNIDVINNR